MLPREQYIFLLLHCLALLANDDDDKLLICESEIVRTITSIGHLNPIKLNLF